MGGAKIGVKMQRVIGGPRPMVQGLWFLLLLSSVLGPLSSEAQAPQLINYQGRLLNGTNLVNGAVGMRLRLYDLPAGGTLLYADSNVVSVVDGLYSTYIGDGTYFGDLGQALTNEQLWLEVRVENTILTPRERLVAVPYALQTRGLLAKAGDNVVLNPDTAGSGNSIHDSANVSAIGGGDGNFVSSNCIGDVVSGGLNNNIGYFSYYSAIGGGNNNAISLDTDYARIDGGQNNLLLTNADYSVIGGGRDNRVDPQSQDSTIAGGRNNFIADLVSHGSIGGGAWNRLMADMIAPTIGGGRGNRIEGHSDYSAIAGGHTNLVDGFAPYSAIGGGRRNVIEGNTFGAVIPGGSSNLVQEASHYAVVCGGQGNMASGQTAFAAGNWAQAVHAGSFVWADRYGAPFTSTTNNQFSVRAVNGTRIVSGVNPLFPFAATSGVELARGSGAWTTLSDVRAKENFRSVDSAALLDKVVALPVREWNYITQDASVRHLGPTAQDFKAAFGLGESDTGISTVDADGVALAAIQALARENAELKARLEAQEARLRALESR